MSNKIIHTCTSDEDGKHIKGLCCIIEDLQKENTKLKEDYLKLNTIVQKELTLSSHSIWGLNKEYLKPVQEDYKDSRIIALGLFNKMINKEEWILKIDGLNECEVFETSEEAISFAKRLIDNEFKY